MADPKIENPVRLDPWQEIVDVHWKTTSDPTLAQYIITRGYVVPYFVDSGGQSEMETRGYDPSRTFDPIPPGYNRFSDIGRRWAARDEVYGPAIPDIWFDDLDVYDYNGAPIGSGTAASLGATVTKPSRGTISFGQWSVAHESLPFYGGKLRNEVSDPIPPGFFEPFTTDGGQAYFDLMTFAGGPSQYYDSINSGGDPHYWVNAAAMGSRAEFLATDFGQVSVSTPTRDFRPIGAYSDKDFDWGWFIFYVLLKSDKPRGT